MLPAVIVRAARTANTADQSTISGPLPDPRTRRIAANAAAFGATDMNAVAGVGAPSYASGVHWWKGTAAALNPRPTVMSESAMIVGPFPMPFSWSTAGMWSYRVEPVTPKGQANPYTRSAELNAPRRKYFSAASFA